MYVDGTKLRELRDDQLLTMTELASLAGVSYDTIWRLEHGRSGAYQQSIKRLGRALGIDPRELVLRAEKV